MTHTHKTQEYYGAIAKQMPCALGTELGGGTHQSYWMADKGGHLARWRNIHTAYTLHRPDPKHPPVVLTKMCAGGGTKSYGWYPQMKAECITFSEEKSTALVIGTNPGYQNAVLIVKNKR